MSAILEHREDLEISYPQLLSFDGTSLVFLIFLDTVVERKASESVFRGGSIPSFHRFTEVVQKHGKGGFRELKSKKFPGGACPRIPLETISFFSKTGHYFISRSAAGLLFLQIRTITPISPCWSIHTYENVSFYFFFVIAFCIFLLIKFSTSDNAFRMLWLVHSISVISSFILVWPYMVNDCVKRC